MNKKIALGGIIVLLAGVSFWAGMAYGKGQAPARGQFGTGQFAGARGAGGDFTMRGNATAGQILSIDSTNMTVKMPDGSTRIVLLNSSVPVLKSVAGSLADLQVGLNVSVLGSANSDGSVSASSIQIRPATSTRSQ